MDRARLFRSFFYCPEQVLLALDAELQDIRVGSCIQRVLDFRDLSADFIQRPIPAEKRVLSALSETGASYSKKSDHLHPNGVIGCIFCLDGVTR